MADLDRKRFAPGSVVFDQSISVNYLTGRALSPEAASVWRSTLAQWIPHASRFVILDVGAGTCRFLPVLSSFAGARVICVEPSLDMLAAAPRDAAIDGFHVAGRGEALPVRDRSCDLAWLSQSYHHMRDKPRCARELRRILRPSGRVLVRNSFRDRLDAFPTLFRFFPGARQISEGLPTVAETVGLFEAHDFVMESDQQIQQQTSGSLREFAARSRLRADSSLTLLSDAEFASGLEDLAEAVRMESEPSPVLEVMTLLVFRPRRQETA